MHAARGTDVGERHHRRMTALLEDPDLSPGDPHIPHTSARQHLDGIPAVVGLRQRLVHRSHAAAAQGVHERVRPQDKALGLALEQTVRLKLGQDSLGHQVLRQGGRLGLGVLLEELSHHPIQSASVDQVAAAQIPDKPFAGAKFGRSHGATSSL